jgi:hypothetical protein
MLPQEVKGGALLKRVHLNNFMILNGNIGGGGGT